MVFGRFHATKGGFALRDYQNDAIQSVLSALERGVRRPAVVLATGGGKTVVFSHLLRQIKPAASLGGSKVLVLAHKEELIKQAFDTIQQANPDLEVAIDMRRLKPESTSDVIVGSVPTLVRKSRLHQYNPAEFKAIILDECHHATAHSWNKILNYFNADRPDLDIAVIGFTATMERSDGKSLGSMFDEIVFERDLLTMIKNKELVDVRFSTIDVDVDLSSVPVKNNDYDSEGLSRAMNSFDVNLLVARSYLTLRKHYNFASTLIFCVDINHCRTLCGVLQSQGINAQYVTGETPKQERRLIIEDFKNGNIDVLCNVQVFTEGTDIPSIDSLFLARPTKSRPLLVQMIGRGLRLHGEKSLCHVVDIAGTRNTGVTSVPTLFSLPSSFTIDGQSYEDMVQARIDYEEDLARESEMEQKEKERTRIKEEQAISRKLKELALVREDLEVKFKSFEGFLELESFETSKYEDNNFVNQTMKDSQIPWVRLEYDIWGSQLDLESFFMLQRQHSETGEQYFSLLLVKFASTKQKIATGYKCGKFSSKSIIDSNKNLQVLVKRAESLQAQMNRINYYSRQGPARAITKKQLVYLSTRLKPRARELYLKTHDDVEQQLEETLAQFDSKRAAALIFAHLYSAKSLWVKWELQRIFGLGAKTKRQIRALSEKLADVAELERSIELEG